MFWGDSRSPCLGRLAREDSTLVGKTRGGSLRQLHRIPRHPVGPQGGFPRDFALVSHGIPRLLTTYLAGSCGIRWNDAGSHLRYRRMSQDPTWAVARRRAIPQHPTWHLGASPVGSCRVPRHPAGSHGTAQGNAAKSCRCGCCNYHLSACPTVN